jgi:hypothetical protein
MGLQVSCALCGFNHSADRYEAREIVAKEMRPLGGNDGFESVEVEPPDEVRRQLELAIAQLYHRYVTHDPFLPRYDVENSVSFRGETQKIKFDEVNTNVQLK